MSKQVYVLNKMYEHPGGRIHPGVSYTADEWLRIFPNLTYEDLNIKDDWFSPKKEEKPKEWEITEFKCKIEPHNIFVKNATNSCWNVLDAKWAGQTTTETMISCGHYDIHSVRRLSDNTVWENKQITAHGEIGKIEIIDGQLVFNIKNNVFPYDYPMYISELKLNEKADTPFQWTEALIKEFIMSENLGYSIELLNRQINGFKRKIQNP